MEKSFQSTDFEVKGLPGLQENPGFKQYAGYIQVNQQYNGQMFFWLCESQTTPESAPLVVWLNGGMGTSSLFGLFLENGPFIVESDLTLTLREYSWNRTANVIYIDQPLGAGYSQVEEEGLVSSGAEIGAQFYDFLVEFYKVFPEYAQRQLFITGESFAGYYIPHMATTIVDNNATGKMPLIPLTGLAVGDGWVDPRSHYDSYPDFAYNNGLIGSGEKALLLRMLKECQGQLESHPNDTKACDMMLPAILQAAGATIDRGNGQTERIVPNLYDIRQYIRYDPLLATPDYPPGEELLPQYLNQPDVKAALHVDSEWSASNSDLLQRLQGTTNESSRGRYIKLIQKMPILFYTGLCDLIINNVSTEQFLENLDWPGKLNYQLARRYTWLVDNEPAGYAKSAEGLTYIAIRNAGHLVPYNVPKVAQAMIAQFIAGDDFSSISIPLPQLKAVPMSKNLSRLKMPKTDTNSV